MIEGIPGLWFPSFWSLVMAECISFQSAGTYDDMKDVASGQRTDRGVSSTFVFISCCPVIEDLNSTNITCMSF